MLCFSRRRQTAPATTGFVTIGSEWAWVHGTAGTASRPVILDPEFVKAAEIFVSVYAPEKMAAFQKWVDGLKMGETQ